MKLLFKCLCCCSLLCFSGCDVDVEDPGKAPDVDVQVSPGRAPDVEVHTPDVSVETREKEVTVPDVDVRTEKKKINVPDVDINIPKETDDEKK